MRRLVLLLVLISSLGACGDDGDDVATPSTSTTTTVTTTTTTIATTRLADGEVPATMFVIAGDGVSERSTSTGQIVRRLTPLPAGLEGPTWIETDLAHDRVFFGGESCDHVSEIWSVPVSGGTPTKIAAGDRVSVSPDGSRLAFPRLEDGCAAGALVVRDLASGNESVWRVDGLVTEILDAAWSRDGRTLAYGALTIDAVPKTFFVDSGDRAARLGTGPSIEGAIADSIVVGDRWRLATRRSGRPIEVVDGRARTILSTLPAPADAHVRFDANGTLHVVHVVIDGDW